MEFLTGEGYSQPVETKSLPEGAEPEDSGFASLVGPDTPTNDEILDPEQQAIIKAQKILEKRREKAAATRAFQKQQKEEKRQNTYKRLLQLVSRSKFYSDLFSKKFSSGTAPPGASSEQAKPGGRPPTQSEKGEVGQVPGTKRFRKNKEVARIPEEVKVLGALTGDNVKEKRDFVPLKYFTGDLRDYQREGLEWLKALYETEMSGILADEMGLGKTIQAIAIIAHLVEQKQAGPYLVVVPLSTTPNWLIEFERFSPRIPVVFLHGAQNKRSTLTKQIQRPVMVDGFKTQPVVLTTYEVVLQDKTFLMRQNWRYLVVDEGQRLKNFRSQFSLVMQEMKSASRLLLTGTPLQNDLQELWSLLHFLMPDIFDDLAVFESWFNPEDFGTEEGTNRLLKQEEEKKVLQSFREILKPFMLRRLKSDVCPDIPPKKEVLVYAPMTKLQHDIYSALLNYDLDQLVEEANESQMNVDDEFGHRPKRRCTYKTQVDGFYCHSDGKHSTNPAAPSTPATPRARSVLPPDQDNSVTQKRIKRMTAYVDVTEENYEYFAKIKMGARMVTYKKIINHPYLIYNPTRDGFPIDQDMIKLSGKFMVLDRMLKKLHEDGHRVLLFSTMTILLDVIEDYLTMRPWKYHRLDGTIDIAERTESIKLFNNDPQYFLFLGSTRAGGVGLNLMGADTVIIFDSDWNPQADIQAMARCHRIGQTKPVAIYTLCTKGSYDEAIVGRARAKRKLEMLVMSKEIEDITFNREGLTRLKQLLEASEYQTVDSEKEVVTEEELNRLLDRSDLIEQMRNPGSAEG